MRNASHPFILLPDARCVYVYMYIRAAEVSDACMRARSAIKALSLSFTPGRFKSISNRY